MRNIKHRAPCRAKNVISSGPGRCTKIPFVFLVGLVDENVAQKVPFFALLFHNTGIIFTENGRAFLTVVTVKNGGYILYACLPQQKHALAHQGYLHTQLFPTFASAPVWTCSRTVGATALYTSNNQIKDYLRSSIHTCNMCANSGDMTAYLLI